MMRGKRLVNVLENQLYQNYEVTFLNETQNYCVGMVDIVNSTKISVRLDAFKLGKYYEIFLNEMARIIEQFDGIVIKNIGDSLLYYFPDSHSSDKKDAAMNCIKCSLAITSEHKSINKIMQKNALPELHYRVSSDYGAVKIMKINNSHSIDIIGKAVNFCTKINRSAPKNKCVIGSEMYQFVRGFEGHDFKLIKPNSARLNYAYPIYLVSKRDCK